MNCQGKLDKDVLVSEVALLEAGKVSGLMIQRGMSSPYFSVVNFPSLYATMNAGDNLNARRFRLP